MSENRKQTKYDPEEIKSKISISEVIGQDTKLERTSPHTFKACCTFHQEKTPSMDINDEKGLFYCFGCGQAGDIFDYIMESRGKTFQQACTILGGEEIKLSKPKKIIAKVEVKDDLEYIFPAPEDALPEEIEAWNPKRNSISKLTFSIAYPYRAATGELAGYILRTDATEEKKKFFTPLTWCKKPDGTEGWCVRALPKPRSLYRLDKIAKNTFQVIICEGEKAADAAAKILKCNTVSWSGGSAAVRYVDWSPLKDRSVAIWADADEAGAQAAEEIKQELFKIGVADLKIVYPPADSPKGFDAADALEQGWNADMTKVWLKKFSQKIEKKEFKIGAEVVDLFDKQEEFIVLGYNDGSYFYLPRRGQQVVCISASGHTKQNLFQLAPLSWWQENFGHLSESGKLNWDIICSALLDKCTRRGIFSETKMRRGRGAWVEAGKKILHLGDVVYIDGESFQPGKTPTKCVYEGSYPISFPTDTKAALDSEAQKFFDICNKFTWANELSGKLLAGWCVIAPICGMLDWRPHIWVTGPSGAGKSTINAMVIKPMLGMFAMFIEGKTTEAGIRQTIKRDALPVVFDEAEAEDKQAAQRMQAVLDLARVASSGGEMVKGSVHGQSIAYCIRSAFCFFAINPSIGQYADESRITKLVLKKSFDFGFREKYNDLVAEINQVVTPEFANSMMKRGFDNIETLLANIRTFNMAAREIFSEKRQADQLAPMLAGAFLSTSTKRLTLDEAKQWIRGEDWIEHSQVDLVRDEDRLLNTILTHILKHNENGNIREATIGEIVMQSADLTKILQKDKCDDAIRRLGLYVDNNYLWIANQSVPLQKILADTPWGKSWAQQLKNIKGAEQAPNKTYGPGINSRGTKIPLTYIRTGSYDEKESQTISSLDDLADEVES